MRWEFVAWAARLLRLRVLTDLPQVKHFLQEKVNLILLPDDDRVQPIYRVFSKAGLYFKGSEAVFNV